jgi:hypothetical protein
VTDARLVTEGFEPLCRDVGRVDPRLNSIYQFNGVGALITVGPAYLGVTFAGVPDPRVPVVDAGTTGSDQATPLRLQKKYTSLDQPIRMASYNRGAADHRRGDGGTEAVNIINALHDAAGLPHFNSGDSAAITAQVIQERSREFFPGVPALLRRQTAQSPAGSSTWHTVREGWEHTRDMRCFRAAGCRAGQQPERFGRDSVRRLRRKT